MSQALEHSNSSIPTADWLVTQHALGRLPRAGSLLAQAYIEMNPTARHTADRIEQVGGWSIEQGDAERLSDGVTATAVLERIKRTDSQFPVPKLGPDMLPPEKTQNHVLPECLVSALGRPLSALPWKWRGLGAQEYRLREYEEAGIVARILRIEPGRAVPQHTHTGLEAKLVISGAYTDAAGRFGAGDLELADDEVDHQPIAEPGDTCICFAVTEAPMKLTGRIGRLFQSII